MRVVVTGATGHIGNVLVRDLIKKGYEVTSLALNEKDGEILKGLDTKIVYGDVRKIETLVKAFEGADMVFHLAGIIEIGSGNKKKVHEVNVNGSKNVVAACKMAHVKRLVYTSSVHAIPEKEGAITETKEFSPKLVKGTYAKSKAEATNYILNSNSDDLEVIITHPSGVIGPYEYIKSNMGQLIIDCANGSMKATLKGGYNFVDVRDVSNGIILAAEKGRPGECYILAGHSISIQDLMAIIEKLTGKRSNLYRGPYGEYNDTVLKAAKEQSHTMIQWSIDSLDYNDLTCDEMLERIEPNLKNGSIILMHSGAKNTASSLDKIIKTIQNKGYELVTVSDLIYEEGRVDNQGVQHSI